MGVSYFPISTFLFLHYHHVQVPSSAMVTIVSAVYMTLKSPEMTPYFCSPSRSPPLSLFLFTVADQRKPKQDLSSSPLPFPSMPSAVNGNKMTEVIQSWNLRFILVSFSPSIFPPAPKRHSLMNLFLKCCILYLRSHEVLLLGDRSWGLTTWFWILVLPFIGGWDYINHSI